MLIEEKVPTNALSKVDYEKIYFRPCNEIIIPPERIRKEFDPEDLRKLAESIKNRRQDTPGICMIGEKGEIVLIAGERRLRACKIAGVPFSFHITQSQDELEILEIEYEENVYRTNLGWFEEQQAFVKLQDIKQRIYGAARQGATGGWGIRDTAAASNVSVGKIHEALELSAYAESFDEVRNAKTKKEAKKVVESIKTMHKRNAALEDLIQTDNANNDNKDKDKSIDKTYREIYLRNMDRIIFGNMTEVLQEDEDLYDIVLFDPPWGVNLDTVRDAVPGQIKYEDGTEYMQTNLPKWLKLIYEKMKEDSHLYLFFGIANYPFIYQTLEQIGFETNRIPLIWYKLGAHRTRNPDVWPGNSYEPIVFARKGNKRLVKLGAGNVISTKMLSLKQKDIHPSAKHPGVYLDLLQRSAFPGDSILDPMCGSAMSGVACDVLNTTHKLKYRGIEIDENYRLLGLENLIKGYYQITEDENIIDKEDKEDKEGDNAL